jgi:hypothetical protein
MLNTQNYKTGRPTKKLEPRWEGPFEVMKTSSHAVTLRLPANMKIFNTFHVSMVRPYRGGTGIPGQEAIQQDVRANRGRAITRDDDGNETEEYRFEKILDCGKAENGRWQYLVKWEGYAEPTWQPATDLRGCDDAIWDFHEAHPDRPGPPSWVPKRRTRRQRAEQLNAVGGEPGMPTRWPGETTSGPRPVGRTEHCRRSGCIANGRKQQARF